MKKKALSLALALVMCLGLTLPTLAAQSDFDIFGSMLMEYKGKGGAVVIPGGVKTIGLTSFQDCTTVTSVVIPEGVTKIEDAAFSGCTGLTSVTLPKSIKNIGFDAFKGTPWLESLGETAIVGDIFLSYRGADSQVTVPEGITLIAGGAFRNENTKNNLTGVTLPGSLTTIGGSAFMNCGKLTSVTIPDRVTSLGEMAFADCTSLTDISVPKGLTDIGFSAFDETPWLRGQGDFPSVNGLLLDYQGKDGNVVIPQGITGSSEFAISQNDTVTSITIPGSMTDLNSSMILSCKDLTSITVPASVTHISPFFITNCENLKDVYYSGTERQWKAIDSEELGMDYIFKGVTVHYNTPIQDPKPVEDPKPVTPPAAPAPASPTNDSLTADGALQSPTVYKINSSNYFKIRDLAAILNGSGKQFSVGYDSALKSVTATTGEGYEKQSGDLAGAPAGGTKTAEPSNDSIYINGEKIAAEVYKIDGSNYFKLRDLGKALNFYVGWSQEQGVFLETDKPYSE